MEQNLLKKFKVIPPIYFCVANLNPILSVQGVENILFATSI